MTHIQMRGRWDAPIERVFKLATEFDRYPQWNVTYASVKEVTGPADRVGTRVTSVMKLLGREVEGSGEIVEVDPPRFLKMSGKRPDGGRMDAIYRFTPADGGTDYEFEIDYELPPGIIGEIANRFFVERAVERDLRHSIENFTALVEEPALATA